MFKAKLFFALAILVFAAALIIPVGSEAAAKVSDCKTSVTCFNKALNKCQPAKYTYQISSASSGIWIESESIAFEIKGLQNKQCVLTSKNASYSAKYTAAQYKKYRASGLSDQQIKQKEKDVSTNNAPNQDATCQTKKAANFVSFVKNVTNNTKAQLNGQDENFDYLQDCQPATSTNGLPIYKCSLKPDISCETAIQ